MKMIYRSGAVALLHMLIILSLGGKLLMDRASRPRVWVKTVTVDPDLPIRGRYLTLRLEAREPWTDGSQGKNADTYNVQLMAENGELIASKTDSDTGVSVSSWSNRSRAFGSEYVVLDQTVAFFLPEHADVPTPRAWNGEELWAEVTLPRKGPPRPIQLALKNSSGWHPLNLR